MADLVEAQTLMQAGRHDDAIACLRVLLRERPDDGVRPVVDRMYSPVAAAFIR